MILLFNSIILFVLSNFYLYDVLFDVKIPAYITVILVILVIIFTAFIILFPSLFCKKLLSRKLSSIRNGYRLLIIFLINLFLDIVLYLISFFIYDIKIKPLLINAIFLVLILGAVFWCGIIRVYLCSTQLGVRYRTTGLILGLIPIAHIIMLIKIIRVCRDEVSFENDKLKLNKEREMDAVCKTRYPILMVHGIFFRDFKAFNYWGRIPEELKKNGATIYYGNHSSSLSVEDSAKELAERIKEIIDETGCEKVNVIAHSKGGLDTRYAIANLGMDKYVASLTMINTPNHGCVFADYLLNKAPEGLKDKVSGGYNFALKKLGDPNPDFIAGVTDLTSSKVAELNKLMPSSENVYYQAFGSVLKKATGGRFPLNLTNNFVKMFDDKNDGLVGIGSFPLDDNFTLVESPYDKGISHGDVIDLNRENIKGYDVREFYVKLLNGLKNKGF